MLPLLASKHDCFSALKNLARNAFVNSVMLGRLKASSIVLPFGFRLLLRGASAYRRLETSNNYNHCYAKDTMFFPLKNTFLSAKITGALKAFAFLATELIIQIGHHREFMKLTLRTLTFRQNEQKNCDLCAV